LLEADEPVFGIGFAAGETRAAQAALGSDVDFADAAVLALWIEPEVLVEIGF